MKNLLILFFSILYGFLGYAQDTKIKKLEYVIVANNEIITKAQLEDYGRLGLIKNMQKSVSEEQRNEYFKKFGNKIGDREFIIKIDLFTKEEQIEREKQEVSESTETIESRDRSKELFLNLDDVAKDFTVQMINGDEITLSDLKGKVVFINYWATWCAPCLLEFAEIPSKILQKFDKNELVFIPIAIGEDKEKARKKMLKMKKYGVDFNVAVDPKKEIWNQYATGAIPKSFLIDRDGIIKYISIGNSEGNVDKLAKEIKKLLSR